MKVYHRKSHLIIFLLLGSLMLGACAQAASPGIEMQRDAAVESMPMEAPAAGFAEVSQSKSFGNFDSSAAADTERLVIKNASLVIIVDDPAASMKRIERLAEEMGGYVVNANLYETQLETGLKVPRAAITIRVDANRLNDALDQIRAESNQIPQNENVTSQDVTGEYTDLQSRLRNLEAAEAQLAEIMGSAVKTEDVLSVYNQLVQVREQIEVIKGQIKYYEQSAALSSISVELMPNEAVQPLTIGGWQPVGVAKDAAQTLIDTLQFLTNLAIWIVLYILPVVLIIYLVFFLPLRFLWRRLREGIKMTKPASPAKPEGSE